MEIQIVNDKVKWEEFLAEHPEANFLQSWYWGLFQEELGRKIFRVGLFEKDKICGVWFCYIEPSKRGKYLVVPGGPIINWGNDKQVKQFAESTRRIAKENACIFVRVRPQLMDDELSRSSFSKMGFRKAPMYLHAELTSQLNVQPGEEELLANMRKATRYEVKKAQKLEIEVSDEYSQKNANLFIKLQHETARRQKFVPFSENFLKTQFNIFIKEGLAKLYTATLGKKVLAQAFIIFYGKEAVYHYGASTDEGRRYPGAYLIQWKAILEAKRRGIERYNFWGVAPEGDTDHRFSGLSLFKRGFGGKDVAYLPAQDLVINELLYMFDYWIEKIRRLIRRS